jgi:hypothetical protein
MWRLVDAMPAEGRAKLAGAFWSKYGRDQEQNPTRDTRHNEEVLAPDQRVTLSESGSFESGTPEDFSTTTSSKQTQLSVHRNADSGLPSGTDVDSNITANQPNGDDDVALNDAVDWKEHMVDHQTWTSGSPTLANSLGKEAMGDLDHDPALDFLADADDYGSENLDDRRAGNLEDYDQLIGPSSSYTSPNFPDPIQSAATLSTPSKLKTETHHVDGRRRAGRFGAAKLLSRQSSPRPYRIVSARDGMPILVYPEGTFESSPASRTPGNDVAPVKNDIIETQTPINTISPSREHKARNEDPTAKQEYSFPAARCVTLFNSEYSGASTPTNRTSTSVTKERSNRPTTIYVPPTTARTITTVCTSAGPRHGVPSRVRSQEGAMRLRRHDSEARLEWGKRGDDPSW